MIGFERGHFARLIKIINHDFSVSAASLVFAWDDEQGDITNGALVIKTTPQPAAIMKTR